MSGVGGYVLSTGYLILSLAIQVHSSCKCDCRPHVGTPHFPNSHFFLPKHQSISWEQKPDINFDSLPKHTFAEDVPVPVETAKLDEKLVQIVENEGDENVKNMKLSENSLIAPLYLKMIQGNMPIHVFNLIPVPQEYKQHENNEFPVHKKKEYSTNYEFGAKEHVTIPQVTPIKVDHVEQEGDSAQVHISKILSNQKDHFFSVEKHIPQNKDEPSKHEHDKNIYYKFEYGIHDDKTKDIKNHKEERKDDEVKGEYSLVEPGGNIRTVKYFATWKNGFHAQVENSKS